VFAIAGAITNNGMYNSFHLTYLIVRSETARNVLLSVWSPISRILMTILLFMILEYYFTLIIFNFYSQDTDLVENCTSMYKCFFVVLDQTFKASGGIGGYLGNGYHSLADDGIDTSVFNFGRIGFDLFFYFVLLIILIQIIGGIIIDKFGELRDNEDIKELDS
jgi:inositol 1,4,5-triphosphate receptor type 1